MNPKLKIGLTGGFASGKSAAAHYFAELNIAVIDTDVIARETVTQGTVALDQIVKHFGKNILAKNGELDRKQLREIIFAQPQEKQWLEDLLHPVILENMQQQIKQVTSPYCVLVIPLLLEKNLQHLVDRVLVIDAPKTLQYQRAQQRDHLSPAQLDAILQTQIAREQRLPQADDVIVNDGDLEKLKQAVIKLHKRYLQLCLSSN
jgi:dephospho-CoA kinase